MNKKNPRLVFVPGLGAATEMYQPLLKHFSDFEIIAADPPANPPANVSWPYYDQPIKRAIGNQGPVVLVGHSLGGAAALHYAAQHPQAVPQVVVIAPVLFPFKRAPASVVERKANLIRALLSGHPWRYLDNFRTSQHRLSGGRMERILTWARWIDLATDLRQLKHATIISPEKDRTKLREHFLRVEREFPNIQTVSVPGRHNYPVLKPRKFIEALRKELNA